MLRKSPPLLMTCLRMRSHRKRLAPGSMPVEGSSMSTTAGLPTRATATLSLRLFPPLYDSHTLRHMPGLVRGSALLNQNSTGPISVEGSFMSITAGLPTRATVTLSLRLFPPLYDSHTLRHMPGLVRGSALLEQNSTALIPVEGSSVSTTRGLPTRATATLSLRLFTHCTICTPYKKEGLRNVR